MKTARNAREYRDRIVEAQVAADNAKLALEDAPRFNAEHTSFRAWLENCHDGVVVQFPAQHSVLKATDAIAFGEWLLAMFVKTEAEAGS